jgi:hypothetical protein
LFLASSDSVFFLLIAKGDVDRVRDGAGGTALLDIDNDRRRSREQMSCRAHKCQTEREREREREREKERASESERERERERERARERERERERDREREKERERDQGRRKEKHNLYSHLVILLSYLATIVEAARKKKNAGKEVTYILAGVALSSEAWLININK